MVVAAAGLLPYRLPLRQPWRGHGQRLLWRDGWLVELRDHHGLRAYGDCAPLPQIGTETPEQAYAALQTAVAGWPGRQPSQLLDELTTGCHPAARCGLETALLDLLARAAGVPLARWLHPQACGSVPVNAFLGPIDGIPPQPARGSLSGAARLLKIKVGLGDPGAELKRVRQLCAGLPQATRLILDANRAWDPDQAGWMLRRLSGLPIDVLEEPLAAPELDGLRRLRAIPRCRLGLDESLRELELEPVLREGLADVLVLKPMLLGGLLPCLALARAAIEARIETRVTTTVDSAVGSWAATHLAAALQAISPAAGHGLDTSRWLERDLAAPPQVADGRVYLPGRPGLGVDGPLQSDQRVSAATP